jgi:putative ABC transport system permease protein
MSWLPRPLMMASLRDWSRRAWGVVLMMAGVALGVAVVVAIDIANTSASRAFELSTEAVVGRATHRIVAGPSGVRVEDYARLVRETGFGPFAPVVEGTVLAGGLDGQPLRLFGIDAFKEAPFRATLGGGQQLGEGFSAFYTRPGAAILPQSLAVTMGLNLGDTFWVEAGGRRSSLWLLGWLQSSGGAQALADDLLLVDLATAQEVLASPDRLTRIDVIASGTEAASLEAMLPAGLRLEPASDQAATAAELSQAFQLNLTALSLLALIVGVFLIYNTLMFSVIQRRWLLGTLRALGTTPGQLRRLVVAEAATVGLLGSVVGLALGWALGQGAVRLVTQTINDFYFVVSVQQAPLTAGTAVKGLLLGLGSSVVAAVGPALEAAGVEPVVAMKRSSLEEKVRGWLPWVSLTGVVLAAAGLVVLLAPSESVIAGFVGMFAILIGLSMLVPWLTSGMMGVAAIGLRRLWGTVGALAARTVVRALSRTSVAIAALMVALSVSIGVGLMIDSFRATVENWLDLTLRADVYVSAPSAGATRPTADLDSAWEQRLASIPGVEAVETFRAVTVGSPQGRVQLSVADPARERDSGLYRFASGTPAEIWARVLDGAVLVSEPFAYRYDIGLPDGAVTLHTDEGVVSFPVAAVYYDYASDRGTVLMADGVYRRYWDDEAVSSLALYIDPAQEQAVRQQAQAMVAPAGLSVQANRSIREEALRVFDRTFAITAALRLLAVVVAFIGVLSALLALQLERRRELATLRALGMTIGGLWKMTLLETGLMGAAAGVLAIPTGLVLALVLIYVINLRSFGWTIQLAVDPAIFLQALLIGLAAALLAGIQPMRRLARLEVADALRQE